MFTPPKANVKEHHEYNGVTIRRFSRDFDQGKVIEFLISKGLPADKPQTQWSGSD